MHGNVTWAMIRYHVAEMYKRAIDELYFLDQTSFGMG